MSFSISSQQGWLGGFLTSTVLLLGASDCTLRHAAYRPLDGSADGSDTDTAVMVPDTADTTDSPVAMDIVDAGDISDAPDANDASETPDAVLPVDVADVPGDAYADASDASLPGGPVPSRPSAASVLAPTRAFLSWAEGAVPAGRTVLGYEICWTTGSETLIDDPWECPNGRSSARRYAVLDPLAAGSAYLWKVRTLFSDGAPSAFSGLRRFATDASAVGWWRLDEGVGAVTLDSSGSGNTGTLMSGPVWAPGFLGSALQFDGRTRSRHVAVADAPSLNFGAGDFTIGAWIFSNSTGVNQAIVDKRVPASGFSLGKLTTGLLNLYIVGCAPVSGGTVTNGVWHHAVARRSSGMITLFLDNVPTATGFCVNSVDSSSILSMGCNPPTIGCTQPFDGQLDDILLRNTAASDDAVLNDYCSAHALSGTDPLPAVCRP